MSKGAQLERMLNFYSWKIYDDDFEDTSGTDLDRYCGTDCIIYRVSIDWTAHFSSKNDMEKLGEFYYGPYASGEYGIRYGNGRVKFEKPVLVIGFNVTPKVLGTWEDAFVEALQKNLKNLIEDGMDLYLNKIDV